MVIIMLINAKIINVDICCHGNQYGGYIGNSATTLKKAMLDKGLGPSSITCKVLC